jgi:hypothetical protein
MENCLGELTEVHNAPFLDDSLNIRKETRLHLLVLSNKK